jgi:putative membrane protein
MFFEPGFLGTRAPMYLDLVAVFFMLLPLLLFVSVRFAVKGEIKKHLNSQLAVFVMTLVMIVVFEVGMRMAGGFGEYMKESSISYNYFITFLIVHIIVALATVNLWSYQIISSVKAYKKGILTGETAQRHRKIAKFLMLGIAVTLTQAASIYYFMFVL